MLETILMTFSYGSDALRWPLSHLIDEETKAENAMEAGWGHTADRECSQGQRGLLESVAALLSQLSPARGGRHLSEQGTFTQASPGFLSSPVRRESRSLLQDRG